MNRMYIARKYGVWTEYGARTIFEEGSFLSYETAAQFLQTVRDDEDETYFTEIVSYEIDSPEPWEYQQIWIFDHTGALIQTYPEQHTCQERSIWSPEAYQGKFRRGDIVIVHAHNGSHLAKQVLGVVAYTPVSYSEWIAQGHTPEEWEAYYTIDFITSFGYLDHDHVQEKVLEPYRNAIPEELRFLQVLSDHYRGIRQIKATVLDSLYQGMVFVKQVRQFTEKDLV
jgi:hypothetical protein